MTEDTLSIVVARRRWEHLVLGGPSNLQRYLRLPPPALVLTQSTSLPPVAGPRLLGLAL